MSHHVARTGDVRNLWNSRSRKTEGTIPIGWYEHRFRVTLQQM